MTTRVARVTMFPASLLILTLVACPSAAEDKLAAATARVDALVARGPYKVQWESLKAHKDAEWFRDAKFGIYTHWGPVTVGSEHCPSGAEWYGRQMYIEDDPVFKYHQKVFGDQKTVGYKDVIPHFKAEKFDADAWADLFAKAGARFAGPVAVHHDNFANWDSQVTRWNAKALGPRRDLVGELEKAIRRRGLKFFTSFHHGFAWRYFEPAYRYDAADPQWADLYGEPHGPKDPPSKRYLDQWLAMVDEEVEKYQPDMIWFDFELGTVIPDDYRRKMFATVYNWADEYGRQIIVDHKFREIQQYTGMLDFERGREDRITPYPWLTDSSVGPWFHHDCLGYRPLGELVDVFVDIVSKNGCLLLNVGPRSDGTIPEKAQEMLLGMGRWLAVNGEAIYGTRPWLVYGEGPTRTAGGGFSEAHEKVFTAADIRFTTKGDSLYAIALAWPKDGKLTVRCVASGAGKVTSVSLLGHAGALGWTQTGQGLAVTLPEKRPCQYAFALKIQSAGLLKPSPQGTR
jgi:alpha-L-fucosidase